MFIALLVELSSSIFIKINTFVQLYINRLYFLPHKLVIFVFFTKEILNHSKLK